VCERTWQNFETKISCRKDKLVQREFVGSIFLNLFSVPSRFSAKNVIQNNNGKLKYINAEICKRQTERSSTRIY